MTKVMDIAREILGDTVANHLHTEGCASVEEFLRRYSAIRIANIKHSVIREQDIELLRCAMLSKHRPLVRSGQHLSQKALERTVVLRTGSKQVDRMLGGGLYTCELVEVYGPAGQGKTQLALHTTALACLQHSCNVVYVDTSNCFSVERMTQILCNNMATHEIAESILKKIVVRPVFEVFELQDMLYDFITMRKSKDDEFITKVKLLVIDNITSLLNPVLGHKSGYTLANSVAILLRRIAVEQHIAVLIINGTVTGQTKRGLPKPALGIQWQHTADKQLLMMGFDPHSPSLYNCQLSADKKHGPI